MFRELVIVTAKNDAESDAMRELARSVASDNQTLLNDVERNSTSGIAWSQLLSSYEVPAIFALERGEDNVKVSGAPLVGVVTRDQIVGLLR